MPVPNQPIVFFPIRLDLLSPLLCANVASEVPITLLPSLFVVAPPLAISELAYAVHHARSPSVPAALPVLDKVAQLAVVPLLTSVSVSFAETRAQFRFCGLDATFPTDLVVLLLCCLSLDERAKSPPPLYAVLFALFLVDRQVLFVMLTFFDDLVDFSLVPPVYFDVVHWQRAMILLSFFPVPAVWQRHCQPVVFVGWIFLMTVRLTQQQVLLSFAPALPSPAPSFSLHAFLHQVVFVLWRYFSLVKYVLSFPPPTQEPFFPIVRVFPCAPSSHAATAMSAPSVLHLAQTALFQVLRTCRYRAVFLKPVLSAVFVRPLAYDSDCDATHVWSAAP